MTGNGKIYYLKHNDIDKVKWDACINNAANGLLYAYSFYLDAFCNWDAVVLNDYEAVMPLPFKKKFTIHYLYQPFLTAQLGLFGNNLSAHLVQEFLNAVPKKFRYWHFSLNHQNLFQLKKHSLYKRVNYVLDLSRSYDDLHKSYRDNIKRNIKKAVQYGCRSQKDIDIKLVTALAKLQNSDTSNEHEYQNFEKLFYFLKEKKSAVTYGVYSNANELLASCVFFFSHKRAYYILVGNHPNGRTLGASHLLIDAFIKDNAGTNLLLDFEGSDIRNLAFFYSSFGATEEKYAAILFNNLPWYAKLFKK